MTDQKDGDPTQRMLEPLISTRIELLIAAFGSPTKVAECLGVTRPLLSKWRAGTVMPTPTELRLIVDLDYVVARASLIFVPEVAAEWVGWSSEQRLGGARPIDVLRRGDMERVLGALAGVEQTAWGG